MKQEETKGDNISEDNISKENTQKIKVESDKKKENKDFISKKSQEKKEKKEDEEDLDKEEVVEELLLIKDELKKTKEELLVSKDETLRLAADFENYRKRSIIELENKLKYAYQPLAEGIVNCLDDFEYAITHIENNSKEKIEVEELSNGLKMMLKKFEKTLQKNYINAIETENKEFDPKHHEATGIIETEEMPSNQIYSVIKRGYMIHDRVMRPAIVQVSKNIKKQT